MLELRAFFREKLDGRVCGPEVLRAPARHVQGGCRQGQAQAVCDNRRWKEVCATLGPTSPGRPARGSRCVRTTSACSSTSSRNTAEVWSWCRTPSRTTASGPPRNGTRPAGDTGLDQRRRGPGPTPPLVNLNLDKARFNAAYNMDDADERRTAHTLGLYDAVEPFELSFLFPGADLGVYITVRNSVLCRWRANPNAYVSVEQACGWFMPKHRAVVHCAHRFLTVAGYINSASVSPAISRARGEQGNGRGRRRRVRRSRSGEAAAVPGSPVRGRRGSRPSGGPGVDEQLGDRPGDERARGGRVRWAAAC